MKNRSLGDLTFVNGMALSGELHMNTIVIDLETFNVEAQKYLGLSLSQMLIPDFIFPEVKIKFVQGKDGYSVYKIKFIDGTHKFNCRVFEHIESEGVYYNIGFSMEWQKKAKQFKFLSLNDDELYALDDLIKHWDRMKNMPLTDELRRELWHTFASEHGNNAVAICYMIMNYEQPVVERTRTDSIAKPKERIIRPKPNASKTYLFNDIVRYVDYKRSKVKHNVTCECWGVRGHYRHYKTGKVVFIHEYKKGKLRGQIQPQDKVYVWISDNRID